MDPEEMGEKKQPEHPPNSSLALVVVVVVVVCVIIAVWAIWKSVSRPPEEKPTPSAAAPRPTPAAAERKPSEVSRPVAQQPTPKPVESTYCSAVAVDGHYAYVGEQVGNRWGLAILDVTNPARPVRMSSLPTSYIVQTISVSDGRAAVSLYTFGLWVVDVKNPAAPTVIATSSTAGALQAVTSGSLVYAACGAKGLQIFDLGATLPLKARVAFVKDGWVRSIALSGHLAYVTLAAWGLNIVDVSRPTSPTLVAAYQLPGHANSVAVSGGRACRFST